MNPAFVWLDAVGVIRDVPAAVHTHDYGKNSRQSHLVGT